MISELRWLWRISGALFESSGLARLRQRLRFIRCGLPLRRALRPFMHPESATPLQRLMADRPETVGAVLWPFQCVAWDASTRLRRIESHWKVIHQWGGPLDFPAAGQLQLLQLDTIAPGLRVVLDQPKWFMREGQLALNLFAGDVRIYTLAFAFAKEGTQVVAYVGAIQGGNTAGIQEDYKDLTKALHGMRPRDFLVELFRTLCRRLGVARIHAVADASRQHRSDYYGASKASVLTLNYDEIWSERGGVAEGDFFVLPVDVAARSLEDVPSKKRAMYRRRYELLGELEQRLGAVFGLTGVLPTEPLSDEPS